MAAVAPSTGREYRGYEWGVGGYRVGIVVASLVSGCFSAPSPVGRACDPADGCPSGLVCRAGVCVSDVPGDGDAGPTPPRTFRVVVTASVAAPRVHHVGVKLSDGRVWMAGGEVPGAPATDSEIYDPAADAWTMAAPIPAPRFRAAAVRLADGRVLFSGGHTPHPANEPQRTAWMYDPGQDAWLEVAPMTSARFLHRLLLLPDGRVLASGGYPRPPGGGDHVEFFDPATGQWTAGSEGREWRYGHGVALLADGSALMFGGASNPGYSDGSQRFHYETEAWTDTATMSVGATRMAWAVRASGDVLVFGGDDPEDGPTGTTYRRVERYEPSVNRWFEMPDMLFARSNLQVTAISGDLFLITGGAGGGAYPQTVELYDPSSGSQAVGMMHARVGHVAIALDEGGVLLAGGTHSTRATEIVYWDP